LLCIAIRKVRTQSVHRTFSYYRSHLIIAGVKPIFAKENLLTKQKVAIGVIAVFITQFVSYLFINARNIAQPVMIAEFDGMALFPWLIAGPALAGSASTLLFGKLSDMYGRRAILFTSMTLFGVGLALSTQVNSMALLVASATFMSIGHFPIIPLCFTAVGDLFSAGELAKWTGLLNLPTGIAALIGPVLGGIIAESIFGWRGLYWGTIPLLFIAGILVALALPKNMEIKKPQLDIAGTVMMVLATTTLILGFFRLGSPSKLGVGLILLIASVVAWVGFIQIEKRVTAPILDPQVLFNRTFITAAGSSFLIFFGLLGIMTYSPIFVQDVIGISPTISGSILTPSTTILSFMGIPAGYLLAKTGKSKWVYIVSYAIVIPCMVAMWRFTAHTPIWIYVLITSVAAFGLGAIPTLNILVAQFSVPKHLIGVAVGAMSFFQMVGLSVAPAILGLAQNTALNLENGIKSIFLVGAVAMIISFILITTIPEVSIDVKKPDK
jgi:MFS family permease